ncbi:MAG TPA: hypothetical protein ENI11_02990 [Actinobacteria bacterium]|nr:hypothetical protein [Actinomycetota bacterium]
MGYSEYLLARDFTSGVGQPLLFLILALSLGLAVTAVVSRLRNYSKAVAQTLTITLGAGWLILVWFHYKIATTLVLTDPTGQLPSGSFKIPVWVENEKFYFWTLILGVLTIVGRSRPQIYQLALNVTLAGFGVLTFFTSNPFAQPLPQFHADFSNYLRVMTGVQGAMVKMQTFHGLHGKMVGYYNSVYMWIHPPLLFIAYSTFVLAFLGCVFMLVKKTQDYDVLAHTYTKLGFILLTVGLLIGYPWAVDAWKGQPWWYDPKINITLMMWVLYSAYLHSRLYIHRKGMWTTTAVLGQFAFLGVVITYLTTYVVPGIHSVAS